MSETRTHCRHIHPSGHRRASPALRNEPFCYYHHTSRPPISKSEAQLRQSHRATFTLLEPDDRTAIQLNLGEIIRRIASHDLDPKRAGLLLYALQIAAGNLPKPVAEPQETIEEITFDDHFGPLAPEQEYRAPGGRRGMTLEQLLREQWAKDDEDEAEREAAKAAKEAQQVQDDEAEDPNDLPTLQAVADSLQLSSLKLEIHKLSFTSPSFSPLYRGRNEGGASPKPVPQTSSGVLESVKLKVPPCSVKASGKNVFVLTFPSISNWRT